MPDEPTVSDSLGRHLILDGLVSEVLSDDALALALPRIVRSVGMTPIGNPVLTAHPWGPSGWQMLSESHICYDYFYREAVCVDLFSCREFDVEKARELIVREFRITRVTKLLSLERGFATPRLTAWITPSQRKGVE